ncbi:MAG: DUF4417 domain-containing protein [Selenomonadaceae bacterium]|nr:DUF4417 domain-containing protein [Selenomonadaceae bacterium]
MNDSAMKKFRNIYKAFMVEGAKFCREFDIPECPCTAEVVPPNLIYYTDMPDEGQCSGFVHFYMDDYKFESVWNHPHATLKKFKRCDGIITPDFSTYQDMPAALKIYNTYRMRAIGYWLGKNGIQVINNVRWGTPETYKYCFLGIPQNTMVCVSTVGCLGDKHDEDRFTEGLAVMIETLNPSHILMYGKRGRNFFDKYIERGIPVKFYDPPAIHKVIFKTRTKIL